MLRQAGPEDAEAIETFLAGHAETSMFLRSNLAAHGPNQTDHPQSTDLFLWENRRMARRMATRMATGTDTRPAAVFGHTRNGFLLAQAPDAPPEALAAFARIIAGRRVQGMTGADDQVPGVLAACGIDPDHLALNRSEPLYRIALAGLADPGRDLRPATAADIPLLARWFADDMHETRTVPAGRDPKTAGQARAEAAIDGPLRLLIEDGRPVAMASLNAQVAGTVQMGSVYVPPDLRRAGRGRAVVVARLVEARKAGAHTAILFAASPKAARVYETIGFDRIGQYRVSLLAEPHVVRP